MTTRVFCSFTSYRKPAVHRKNTSPTLKYTHTHTHTHTKHQNYLQSLSLVIKREIWYYIKHIICFCIWNKRSWYTRWM